MSWPADLAESRGSSQMSAPADPVGGRGHGQFPGPGRGPELVIAGLVILVGGRGGKIPRSRPGRGCPWAVHRRRGRPRWSCCATLLPTLTPESSQEGQGERSRQAPAAGAAISQPALRAAQLPSPAAAFYDGELRPVLEHPAGRPGWPNRHGRAPLPGPETRPGGLLCRRPRDADLWAWIDPEKPAGDPRRRRPGPRRGHPRGTPWRASSTDWRAYDEHRRDGRGTVHGHPGRGWEGARVVGRRRTPGNSCSSAIPGRRPRPARRTLPGLGKTLIARSFAPAVLGPRSLPASSSPRTCCPRT